MSEGNDVNVKNLGSGNTDAKNNLREISEVLQISPDPSKAPLNHINNLKEREATLESYKSEVRQKQKELLTALELTEDKKSELDRYKDEKMSLDISLNESEGVLYQKLSRHIDFINDVYDKVEDLFKDDGLESEAANNGKYQIPIQVKYDSVNNKVIITANREITEDEKSQINPSVLGAFQDGGVDTTNMEVEYIVQEDLDLSGAEVQSSDNSENTENSDKDVLEQYLQMVNPDNFSDVLNKLKYSERGKLKKLEKDLRDLVDEYFALYRQIDILSTKIKAIQEEYYNYSDVSDSIQDNIDDMGTDIEEKGRTYFLNSYLSIKKLPLNSFVSSPLVEKQISNIIEMNKKGLPLPKTILLYGKSNLGKSYAANVLATELGRKMYHIKSYDLFEGGYSDPNEMLDMVFTTAIKIAEPCIIFLDEIEDFAGGDNGGTYQNLVENTIRHHISKIRESSLDIMVIGAISNRNKVGSSLMKQDVFAKQIYFTPLPKEKYEQLFYTMMFSNGVKIGEDVDVESLLQGLKDSELDQEYLKKLIAMAIDFNQLNGSSDASDIVLSANDFKEARDFMSQYSHNVSQGVGFNNK